MVGAVVASRYVLLTHTARLLPLGVLLGVMIPLLLVVQSVLAAVALLAVVGAVAVDAGAVRGGDCRWHFIARPGALLWLSCDLWHGDVLGQVQVAWLAHPGLARVVKLSKKHHQIVI